MSDTSSGNLERGLWLAMVVIGLVGAALLAWATLLPSGPTGMD